MNAHRILAPAGSFFIALATVDARADTISGTINTEWFISTPATFQPFSLPAVLSIDSFIIEPAHANGNNLWAYVDALNIPGDFDFDLMYPQTAGGFPSFTMGMAPGNGTLANGAPYTFVTSGPGEFTAPHSALALRTAIGRPRSALWLAGGTPHARTITPRS